ncbi:septum formation protein Maf [Puteibacter caeruleilacunae]|nr:septum formation protein Maf [Puteibacter caeruleilacunae]
MRQLKHLNDYTIVLASKSPRRQQLLKDLGIEFSILTYEVDESYPESLPSIEVAEYLAKKKLDPFFPIKDDNAIIITSDTTVCIEDEVLGKPADEADAYRMLRKLSGKMHQVITGVAIASKDKSISFSSTTNVHFKELTDDEILHYIANYKPFDKAGAYGIQEWIGYIGIDIIEGSYFNVMGLPVQRLYEELNTFIEM